MHLKFSDLQDKSAHNLCNQNGEQIQTESCELMENETIPPIPQADYRFARDSIMVL